MKNIKDENGFWKLVNTRRGKREKVCKGVKKEEWMNAFKTVICGKECRCNSIVNKENQKEGTLTRIDIKEAIGQLKKKKVAGEDGIMNEAWLYGENWLEEDLETIFNETLEKWRK